MVGITTLRRAAPGRQRVAGMLASLMIALTLLAGGVAVALGQQEPVSSDALDELVMSLNQGATAQPTEPAPVDDEPAPAGNASANLSAAPDGPPALAQGLIYLTGEDVVWQVREVELASPAEAEPVTGSSRFVLQRTGVSIIRNDVTGKRTRLEKDEAYYAAAGDAYTLMASEDSRSVVWVFEVANSDEVGEGAFYLSPNIGGVAEGTYDLEFTHRLLDAGETTGFVSEGGPFLIMVLTGQVAVSDGAGAASLVSGDGRIVEGNATIEAEGDGQAVYVVVAIGASVSDTSAAAPAPTNTGDDSPGAGVEAPVVDQPSGNTSSGASGLDPAGDADNDYMTNGDEIAAGLDPNDPDTDADRILDGQEWSQFGTDPFVADSDGDGLIDGAEYDTTGTDPAVWDTDGDGWGDGDEFDAGTDPLDPSSIP